MKQVLVCVDDSLLQIRVSRILTAQNISYDITKNKIAKSDLINYDCLVIHSSYLLTGLYGFVENLVLSETIPVVFISLNGKLGSLQRLKEFPTFIYIDEVKMDAEMPIALQMFRKQTKRIDKIAAENKRLKQRLDTEKAMNTCKRLLIETGLNEEEAHQKILKTAMDEKISKYMACKKIIKSLE